MLDWRAMMGGLLGSAAQDLGYPTLAIKPRQKNAPPQLLPSQQAMSDMHDGMAMGSAGKGGEEDDLSGTQKVGGVFSAMGRSINHPNDVNIVGEEGPEAIVGQKVIPLSPERRMEGTPNSVTQNTMVAPEQHGLIQTEQDSLPQRVSPQPEQRDRMTQLEDRVYDDMQIKPSPWKDLGAALIQGGNNFFNHKDEPIRGWGEIKRDRKLARDLPPLQMERDIREAKTAAELKAAQIAKAYGDSQESLARGRKLDADIKREQEQDAQAGKKWTKLISNNKIFKQFPDGRTEPWIDPTTNEQGVDEERVTAPVPGTKGETVSVSPSVRLNNATTLEVGNAQRTQDINKFNADKALEVQKTNVSNAMKFADDTRSVLTAMAQANAQILSGSPGVSSSAERLGGLANQISELRGVFDDPNATDEQRETAFKQISSLQDDMGRANKEFYDNLGKVQGGKELAEQLKKAMPKAPKVVTFTPQTASTVGGKVAYSADVDDYAKTKGWTRKQAESYLKSQGYTIQ